MGFLTVECAHMQIGYARVSTLEQNVAPQIDQLNEAGCERIFRDKASGAKTERPGLQEAIEFLREGDMLVVWRLDRLGRRHLCQELRHRWHRSGL